jgi:hypothetical protein
MPNMDRPDPNACEMQVIEALAETVCLLVGCLATDHEDYAGTWLDQLEEHANAYVCGQWTADVKGVNRAIVEHNLMMRSLAIRSVFDRARNELAITTTEVCAGDEKIE